MWYFVAVLVLWGTTVELAGWQDWVLSPITLWTWWTFNLYVCGIAATTARYVTLGEKLLGLFAFVLVVAYYRTMSDTYMGFIPEDASNPDMWPTIFLSVNLVGPLLLATVGPITSAIRRQ